MQRCRYRGQVPKRYRIHRVVREEDQPPLEYKRVAIRKSVSRHLAERDLKSFYLDRGWTVHEWHDRDLDDPSRDTYTVVLSRPKL